MKRYLVTFFALLVAGHAFAIEQCVRQGQALYSAAAQRDKGISQDEVTKSIRRNFAPLSKYYDLEKMVAVAFKHYEVSPELLQSLASAKCEDDLAQTVSAAPAKAEPVSAAPTPEIVASGYSHTFDVCMSKSDGVTADMLDCIGDETNKQDVQLNKNYAAAMMVRKPDQRDELKLAERAWIKERDSKCSLDTEGGTAAQVNSASCVLDMTAQRARELLALRPGVKP